MAAATVGGPVSLYAVWTGIGLVSGAVLYGAAFPVIVSWYPEPHRRQAVLVLAVVHGCLTIPLHLVIRKPAGSRPLPEARSAQRADVGSVLRDRGFWSLAVAFVASGAAVSVVGVHLVAYLIELGHGATAAAWVAGGLGVLSVSGRLITTAAQGPWPLPTVVGVVFALQAAGMGGLVLVGSTTAGALVCVVLVGLGFGVGTIARPALLADRFGTAGFATLTGVMAVPFTVVKAGAPLAAAWVHDTSGDRGSAPGPATAD